MNEAKDADGGRRNSRKRVAALSFLLFGSLSLLSVGCSNVKELDYKPVRMDTDPARARTKAVSSRLLEMTGVKGKVTEPGPSVSRCEEYGDDLFSLRHPWSLYDLSGEDVDRGMSNLRKALDRDGWKILKDGKADSRAQDPEIYAENKAEQFDVHVTGVKRAARGDTMITFTVVSACFRAASSEALDGQY
ncbi:hypothetical protein [Streptomyces sp. NPDC014734]|uniref:hypothetical protein n=1 Tax=Streptomyces sp. NPDC014734 TaxID=3364886 RepID=UPI0036FCB80F